MNCQSLFFNTLVERIGMAPVDFQRDQTAVPSQHCDRQHYGGRRLARIAHPPRAGTARAISGNSNAWLGEILAVLILVAVFLRQYHLAQSRRPPIPLSTKGN